MKVYQKILICSMVAALVFALVKVFSGSWQLGQVFTLGPVSLRYYGLAMATAVGAGWWLAGRRASSYGLTPEQVDSVSLWLVVGGFVGARLYHVASSWQYYVQYPLDAMKVWHGGLSIFGALIGGFMVLVLFAKRLKTPLFRLLDWLAPSVVLGQIIGRFGNFFNYEAFGYPTNVPWKMFVPEIFRPAELMSAAYFHPLFLYEALGNCLVLYIVLKYSKKAPAGGLFFGYLFLYNILRFALEHLRVDSTFLWGDVRLNAIVSALLCLVGAAGYYYVHNKTSQTTSAQMEKS